MKLHSRGLVKTRSGNSVADYKEIKVICKKCQDYGWITNIDERSTECPDCGGNGYTIQRR